MTSHRTVLPHIALAQTQMREPEPDVAAAAMGQEDHKALATQTNRC